jgi:hypothetical protein
MKGTFMKFCVTMLALLLIGIQVNAQCVNGSCNRGGNLGFTASPQPVPSVQVSYLPTVQYARTSFTIPEGHVLTGHEIWPDGSRRPPATYQRIMAASKAIWWLQE